MTLLLATDRAAYRYVGTDEAWGLLPQHIGLPESHAGGGEGAALCAGVRVLMPVEGRAIARASP